MTGNGLDMPVHRTLPVPDEPHDPPVGQDDRDDRADDDHDQDRDLDLEDAH
jgi:hypothetical protein